MRLIVESGHGRIDRRIRARMYSHKSVANIFRTKTMRSANHCFGSRRTDTSSSFSSKIRWAGPSRSSYCPLRTDHQKTRPISATITTDSGISKKRMSMCSVCLPGCNAIRHRIEIALLRLYSIQCGTTGSLCARGDRVSRNAFKTTSSELADMPIAAIHGVT